MREPKRVGVRELRQNLSVYLRRVKRGEALDVTERGQPVARLVPAATGDEWYDRMVAEGRIRPATGRLQDLAPPKALPPDAPMTITEALDEQRAERL